MDSILQMYVPITEDLFSYRERGQWDRLRRRNACLPLDFWGRHRHYLRNFSSPDIPHDVKRGFGSMHLEDWLSPVELIGPALILGEVAVGDKNKKTEQQHQKQLENTNKDGLAASAPSAVVKGKDIFEVELNVSDYKPGELKVTILDGLVTIEGEHEEELQGHGHISTYFKRTLTLPKNVLDDQLECKLSKDGYLTLRALVKAIGPAPNQLTHPSSPIMQCREESDVLKEQGGWEAAVMAGREYDEVDKDKLAAEGRRTRSKCHSRVQARQAHCRAAQTH